MRRWLALLSRRPPSNQSDRDLNVEATQFDLDDSFARRKKRSIEMQTAVEESLASSADTAKDIRRKFIPLFAYCTVGTTATAIVDHLDSIGPVAERAVLEYATSINVSLHKFMLHGNGDLIYTKEMPMLSRAFQSCQESIKIWNVQNSSLKL
ncbi:hypothetical protein Q1695_015990 [Nippostrongylus brasiliensis]|nr:hypothetical protein Q1695_015990 [Nippostrongylus brasiliensis]